MNTLKVDPEFKALIPPLNVEEYAALKASLQAEGCRDALVVWNDTIIDGHNRYELCQELGIAFQTVEREFEDRNAAMLWMIDNQLARRNLTDALRIRLAHRQVAIIAEKAKQQQGINLSVNSRKPVHTDVEAGKIAGVGESKFRQGAAIIENAPEAIQRKWDASEISTHRAYKLTQALKDADPDIVEAVAKWDVDEPDTVEDLKRLKKSNGKPGSNGTWDEIVKTGYIQPGDEQEAVHISDSPSKVKQALGIKSDIHREIASDEKKLQTSQLLTQANSHEWYTPARYVNAARLVMGAIDVDPASNDIANQTIKATTYYTKETNGLDKEWRGRVWLNPPYKGLSGEFIARLIEQYEAGIVTEAVVLVNSNSSETAWFAPLWDYVLCFANHRINFESPEDNDNGSTHGSVFIYLGPNRDRFAQIFDQFGYVVMQLKHLQAKAKIA